MSALTVAMILAWIAILILMLAVSGLIRTVSRLSSEAPATWHQHPIVGTPAPVLADIGPWVGEALLMFVDPTCAVCISRIEDLKDIMRREAMDEKDSILVTADSPNTFDSIDLNGLRVVQADSDYISRFAAHRKPFGVLVGSDGRVRKAMPLGNKQMLEDLISFGFEERQ